MSMLTKLTELITGARAAVSGLHRADRALRDRLEALKREEVALLRQPAPREELERNIRELVHAAGLGWRNAIEPMLVKAASGAVVRDPSGHARVSKPHLPIEVTGAPITFNVLAGLAPDVVAHALIGSLRADVQTSLPMGERPERLAEIAREIEATEQEHASMADQAKESGIDIKLMDGEAGRRHAEAQRQKREEAIEAAKRSSRERPFASRVNVVR